MRRRRVSNWLINVPVFVVAVLFLLGTCPALADNSAASYALDMDMVTADIQSNISATAGDTIEIGVFAKDVTNLSTSNVALEWDTAILTLIEAKQATTNLMTGSIFMAPDVAAANVAGNVVLTQFLFSGGATGSGYVFSVKFELKSDASAYITMGAETAFSDLTTGTEITVNPTIDKKCIGGVNVTETTSGAAFTYSVNGTVVTFTNNSTNSAAYTWDFGDGETSTEFAPVHTYASDQTPVTVTLTAAGLGCQVSTHTEPLFGNGITANPLDITAAANLITTNADLVIIDVAASIDDGRIANSQNIAIADLPGTLDSTKTYLVYCRVKQNAIDGAQALVDAGFGNVNYLDADFSAFAADTTNVTDAMVEYKLTITIAGTGTGTVTVDGTAYADAMWIVKDTTVVIVATPETGSIFDGFSIDTPDTAGNLTMNASKNVTATFSLDGNNPPVADVASFTVAVGSQVSGTLTGSDPDGDTFTFSVVTNPTQGSLTINADGSFVYDNPTAAGTVTFEFKVTDSKGLDSAPATVTITVTEGPTYSLTLNVNPAEGGTATADTAGPYAAGTVVNITATPATGYRFVNWTGDVADVNAAATTVTMDADKTVTANFVGIDKYALTLNVNPAEGGTANADTAGPYDAGTVVNITATPATGYQFLNWTGDVADVNAAATTVTMDADKTVTANFEAIPPECDLTSVVINPSTSGGEAPLNVSLTATVTGTADTYAWNVTKDGAAFQTANTATMNLNALAAGNYTVSLTVSNSAVANCSMDAATALIQVTSGGETPDGDGNGDGFVDIYDALLAAMYDVQLIGEADIARFAHLDVDQNGVVNINDALAIARYDVGLTCTCTLDQ